MGLVLWKRGEGIAGAGDRAALEAVRGVVASLSPERTAPRVAVGYTGAIPQAVEEQDGALGDLTIATVLCAAFVILSIWSVFRRPALVLVIFTPATLGVLIAVAFAWATIGHFNLSTAFLISVLLGNGINSPIIILSRYGELRADGVDVDEALVRAIRETRLGAFTAMAAASIAYASLLLTTFRGFNQFGLIGGVGMIVVYFVTVTLLPPLVILGERRFPGRFTPGKNLWLALFVRIGGVLERRPRTALAVTAVLLVASVIAAVPFVRDPLEWNLNKMNSVQETQAEGLLAITDAMHFHSMGSGKAGNHGVLVVDHPEQAEPVASAIRAADKARGKRHLFKAVRTLWSQLPSDQTEKLALLGQIRAAIDAHVDQLDDSTRAEVRHARPPDELRALTVDDLPRAIQDAFTEVDGQRGRLIGMSGDYSTYSDWNGRDLIRISEAMQVDALGKTWRGTGAAAVFAGMIEAIVDCTPRVTVAAIVGVTLLLLGMFGPRAAAPALAALGIGIVWLCGLMSVFGLKINFVNFVALPISIGVGADYVANMRARLAFDEQRGVSLGGTFRDVGSAIALCSLTTIIGYTSLLVARNQALRSFGIVADLGEATCLVAALVALPCYLRRVKVAPRSREVAR